MKFHLSIEIGVISYENEGKRYVNQGKSYENGIKRQENVVKRCATSIKRNENGVKSFANYCVACRLFQCAIASHKLQ